MSSEVWSPASGTAEAWSYVYTIWDQGLSLWDDGTTHWDSDTVEQWGAASTSAEVWA